MSHAAVAALQQMPAMRRDRFELTVERSAENRGGGEG